MLPTIEDIRAAAKRIEGVAVRTPLLRSDVLDEATGARVFVKAECLQRGGAFKLRGAYNKIAALTQEECARGVIAFSSGNHAIGVATAARLFAIPAFILMPADAPRIKIDATRAQGAEVMLYDRLTEKREEIGARLAAERGAVLVKPFDDALVVAGQGTIGLEIGEAIAPDIVLAPASGAGLACGVALALPGARVYAVEPQGHDDIARSLASARIESNAPGIRSICDALLVERMGEITFAIARDKLAGALAASDDSVRAAMQFAFQHLKIVLEPSGAIALAAVLDGALDLKGKTVAIIASGGNVDAETFAAVLSA
jgi:threonine dehydratase